MYLCRCWMAGCSFLILLGFCAGTLAADQPNFVADKRQRSKTSDKRASVEAIEDYKRQIDDLKEEMTQALGDVKEKWAEIADDMTQIPIKPYKKDILLELFGVAWMPFLVVDAGGMTLELPGFESS